MNNLTRRGFMGATMGVVAGTALGQEKTLTPLNQAKKNSRPLPSLTKQSAAVDLAAQSQNTGGKSKVKNFLAKLDEFNYLLPEMQEFLLENGINKKTGLKGLATLLHEGFYPPLDADYRIVASGGVIFVHPLTLSERNLFGSLSGFDYTVPQGFGFAPDKRVMDTIPAEEKEEIEAIIKLCNRAMHIAVHFPFCTPKEDVSDGAKMSGRVSRDPISIYDIPSRRSRVQMDRILQATGVHATSAEKAIYDRFGYPTTTEEAAKAKLSVGRPSGSRLFFYLGVSDMGVVIFRGLKKYPFTGTPDLGGIYDDIQAGSRMCRTRCLENIVRGLDTTLSCTTTGVGRWSQSDSGKKILIALKERCEQEYNGIAQLKLESMLPKGGMK